MAAQFVTISRQDMVDFLSKQGFMEVVPADLPSTRELVMAKVFWSGKNKISLRVFTSIEGDKSRDVGEDAIRVVPVFRTTEGKIVEVGKSRRVHRVASWRDNMQERIDNWSEGLGPACRTCGKPTVLRKPKQNQTWEAFYGCCDYPTCRGNGKILQTKQEKPALNKLVVPSADTKTIMYLGEPVDVKNNGRKIEGWQPTIDTFILPDDWELYDAVDQWGRKVVARQKGQNRYIAIQSENISTPMTHCSDSPVPE